MQNSKFEFEKYLLVLQDMNVGKNRTHSGLVHISRNELIIEGTDTRESQKFILSIDYAILCNGRRQNSLHLKLSKTFIAKKSLSQVLSDIYVHFGSSNDEDKLIFYIYNYNEK